MSSRKLAVIMDPIESIKPHKDSSFAMLVEAQTRELERDGAIQIAKQMFDVISSRLK